MSNELLKASHPFTYAGNNDQQLPTAIRAAPAGLITAIRCSPLARPHNIILKRLFDITISLLVIVCLLSWLLPILALLIKLDSRGPVFFLQQRNKQKGGRFACIKLRTMVVNPEADTMTATFNDKRITALGNFLRISHLDELPQFLNVLWGDMSVIGPRPHMVAENIKYNILFNYYNDRHFVKPGITGLAQSLGYYGPAARLQEIEQKLKFDLYYINHWSLGMDIKIMMKTIVMIYNKKS
ncbi:sugar transferase [Chitinophaga agrisoli]|nr:sugar transferase [Chitinophaga agrisoli]